MPPAHSLAQFHLFSSFRLRPYHIHSLSASTPTGKCPPPAFSFCLSIRSGLLRPLSTRSTRGFVFSSVCLASETLILFEQLLRSHSVSPFLPFPLYLDPSFVRRVGLSTLNAVPPGGYPPSPGPSIFPPPKPFPLTSNLLLFRSSVPGRSTFLLLRYFHSRSCCLLWLLLVDA